MSNPWENVSLNDYENHMKLPIINQIQTLNSIMKCQINKYDDISTIAILGISGGNGLEYINPIKIKTVYGIDINQNYLDVCRQRYDYLSSCLILENLDISNENINIPKVDLVIANLFIEYIGVKKFIKQIEKTTPRYVSCVIQKNLDVDFVSDSPYTAAFNDISKIHNDIAQNDLIIEMNEIGYSTINSTEIYLPNKKMFIWTDFFIRHCNIYLNCI